MKTFKMFTVLSTALDTAGKISRAARGLGDLETLKWRRESKSSPSLGAI